MKSINRENGYTLVELMVVMMVMGGLALGAMAIFIPQFQKLGAETMKAEIMSLSKGQETFMVKTPGSFGTTSANLLQSSLSDLSRGTYLGTSVKDSIGYCIVGYSTTSMSGNHPENRKEYIWYDSLTNGFPEAPNENTAPIGGACEGVNPSSDNLTWFKK